MPGRDSTQDPPATARRSRVRPAAIAGDINGITDITVLPLSAFEGR